MRPWITSALAALLLGAALMLLAARAPLDGRIDGWSGAAGLGGAWLVAGGGLLLAALTAVVLLREVARSVRSRR
ncbi:hypothetical protein [Arenivirga flava]|uniref:Uncharacterized protein n=1 Tax=Arenivirga flava TaxID=1930060 RepID=A0AA37UIU5_9MICO|nr:hypothetical protein [Arenivirga flava]GMA28496.1 hypothetical protein GCM10025874_17490 [Arenivirga flava]